VAHRHRDSVVIGSDQVALFGREIIGKPGNPENSIAQLKSFSGQRLAFHTAVHVVHSDSGANEGHVDLTTVHFRKLGLEEIERYVARERPVNCAGAFKAEAQGISLFERIDSQDPTALIGLPLIWLSAALRRAGFQIP
jgi:septum formation protein